MNTIFVILIYLFIAFSVYFALRLVIPEEYDEWESVGIAIMWPPLLVVGVAALPFIILNKVAEYIRTYIKQDDITEEDDDEE